MWRPKWRGHPALVAPGPLRAECFRVVTNQMGGPLRSEAFSIHVDEGVLADLRDRIAKTRWPDQIPGIGWQQGADLDYLKELLAHWAEGFNWRAQERWLNGFDHFHADLDGIRLHFVHQRARSGHGIPLILTHGWPSSFVEYLAMVPLLTDPDSHGIDGPGFDVVVPSLPGYGFSQRPARTGVNYRYVAGLWHELMQGLGYERYGAGGGDFGAGVASFMALDDPEPLLGIHLNTLEIPPYTGPGSRPLSDAERFYLAQSERWWRSEQGYKAIQSTKPQTLGYALNDSPAGLAAWILEKWRSWGDTSGDLDAHFSRDFLLTNLMIYWVTQTITPSIRDYFDNSVFSVAPGPNDFVAVPTGVAIFAHYFEPEGNPPREWAERLYNVRRWTVMPRGGHFAPVEEPELLARDIADFFAVT
jgi:pimeloyl-ACP methyl ester carboxylesterase